ncbi:MAG: hypothetical protein HY519_03250 [Candidatus Aenigmarchaeota archaeon]|nr:hypothetical protein [Candidatus Aenigmarchaeota archaeon]
MEFSIKIAVLFLIGVITVLILIGLMIGFDKLAAGDFDRIFSAFPSFGTIK